jgi:multidrug efflux system membrane fusion protein
MAASAGPSLTNLDKTAAPAAGVTPPPRKRALWPWVLALMLTLVAALLVWRWLAAPAGSGRPATPPQAVGVAAAALADVPILDAGLGTVTPLATITVQSQISGLLQSVAFTEGQIVQKGDLLAQIDPRPYQALLAQARGALARDEALLAQAQLDEKRYARLNKQDSIASQQAEDQHFVVLQDQGTVAADQGTIQTQLVNLAFCRITSPVTGRVGLRQVDAGNYITPALTNGIVVVTQLQPISVIFTLPEDDLPAIMARLAAHAILPVTVFDRDNVKQLGVGSLTAVDTQIDTTTGTVKLRAQFENADNALFPSQFVNANLLVDTHTQVVTVPNAALQTGSVGSFVYVVGSDNIVSVRKVQLGAATADVTEITQGLKAGERVVIDGADRLRDGAHVTVPGPQPAGGAAPTSGDKNHRRHKQE